MSMIVERHNVRVRDLTVLATGIIGLGLLVFASILMTGTCLFSTDNNIGSEALGKSYLPEGFVSLWTDMPLLGSGITCSVCWLNVMLWLLPAQVYMNWIHAIDLGIAAFCLAWFLRRRELALAACALAGAVAFWTGSNLTLVYAGHTGKFGVLMFAAVFLLCVDQGVRRVRAVPWAIVCGGVLGLMLLEQQDLAFFFALFLGSYVAFRSVREHGWCVTTLLARAVPMGVAALLVAGASAIQVYVSNVGDTSNIGQQDAPQAKWEFCTQWSVPPNETIDLIAPNYFGIRSGEPEGPYWGRTGQSADWEQTHKGFMNFKLESIYIGAIPVVLALFAVAAALLCRRSQKSEVRGQKPEVRASGPQQAGGQRAENGLNCASQPSTIDHQPAALWPDRRAEILFWGVAALITLLLAYGKYFPLYALFYKLPVVNNIRNPNKFLQVFQLCLGILAAYGLDTAVRMRRPQGGD